MKLSFILLFIRFVYSNIKANNYIVKVKDFIVFCELNHVKYSKSTIYRLFYVFEKYKIIELLKDIKGIKYYKINTYELTKNIKGS
ncbi:MAG: hypothetical protein Kow0068_20780 [Marinilabiliales bacterium]